jgi:8-amino-7-oxononanoate synthase
MDAQRFDGPPGPEVRIDDQPFLYFGGTGYLGIQSRPELAAAADLAFRRYGIHPATSRSGFGETHPLLEAEAAAAGFFGVDECWLLPTGWAVGAALMDAHRSRVDRLFLDIDAHYALREAARASGRPIVDFDHLDPDALRSRIDATLLGNERPVVLTDGVFPVSGRIAPLDAYLDVLAGYDDPLLLVDDAHGVGVVGPDGHGTVAAFGLSRDERVRFGGTASKALGGYGGLLPGTTRRVEELKERCRWFEGSTPLPTPIAAATAAALRIARDEPQLRAALGERTQRLRGGLRDLGLTVEDLPTPIVPLVLSDADAMRRLAIRLRQAGILVPYLPRYAGIGSDGALRIAVFATHTTEQIDRLLEVLGSLL